MRFLRRSATSRTMTTLRSATWGAPAWRNGPAILLRIASTCEPPWDGRAALPNRVRRNGMRSTNVKPSSTDASTVATIVAVNSLV